MKKIFILIFMNFFTLPVFAVCSITGEACNAPSNFAPNTLQDKYVPDNLKNLNRTDSFQPQIVPPYGQNVNHPPVQKNIESGDYDANRQFGNYLPENSQNIR